MRLPLSWLRDFVAIEESPERIAERLGTAGFEIEGILRLGAPDREGNHGSFVIGRVEHFEKHPNADRLRLCQVDTGDANPRQIVCGASNFAVGDVVVVALPGALLPGSESPLKQAKLRGQISDGMMLSERELGLSDEHDGIIILPAEQAPVAGSMLRDHIALDEVVLDISVESNRGDCLSVYGLAREVAVLFDLELAPFPGVEPPAGPGVTADLVRVAVNDPKRCSRFTARGFVDAVVRPSPLRVRQRLAASGIRPISNVVDVTNYVMHELGNPLHAYDANTIAGRELTARLARPGEVVRTLDDRERVLDGDMLVIADAAGASGVAGIMGGLASEISESTTAVVLEAACFERGGIQRTSKALGLRTDGSNRWEKGVSPHLAPIASVRAAELIVAWSGATMLSEPLDVVASMPERENVVLRAGRVEKVLGIAIDSTEVKRIVSGLGFAPEALDGALTCTIPWWRWLDATREIDLIEEIGRVHGLVHVPSVLPRIPPGLGGMTSDQRLRRRAEEHLAGLGLREVSTLSLVDPDQRSTFGLGGVPAVKVRNPLSADLSELRTSLVPSLVGVLTRNAAVGERDVQIFEFGRAHRMGHAGSVVEDLRVGIMITGDWGGSSWTGPGAPCDFGTMAAVVDSLAIRLGICIERRASEVVEFLHPGRSAGLWIGERRIGLLGELHPALVSALDLPTVVAVAEFDFAGLADTCAAVAPFTGLSEFPPVLQDIAVIVDDDVSASALLAVVRDHGGYLLDSATVFDVFADADRVGTGRVSIGVRLVFRAADRTLTDDEASDVRDSIVAALAHHCGAELRG